MPKLPFKLPAVDRPLPGQSTPVTVNPGSYDVLIGGHGFRLATDQQFPYTRTTEPTTTHRYDSSLEPGEQSLSPLPWKKSQSTFHAGAGQQNLEAPFTAFQFQQEQVQHTRYDMSQNVDPWTPGIVKRLPDVNLYNFGFSALCTTTAVISGVDYAIVGGIRSLYQVAWNSGPDAAPTITAIDMSSATFGGMSNITVNSLTTDGTNYYAVILLGSAGSTPGILTYVVSGNIASAAAPTALYEVPNFKSATPRTNLCTNPSFETGTTSWAGAGGAPPTLTTGADPAALTGSRASALKVTWATGTSGQFNGPQYTLATTVGKVYTISAYVYVVSGPPVGWLVSIGGTNFGSTTGATQNAWVRVSFTFTATSTSHTCTLWGSGAQTSGQIAWVDEVLMEQAGGLGAYFDGATTADISYNYSWSGTADASTSLATPIANASQAQGVVGWVKERLIGALSNSIFELPVNVPAHTQLPSANYTHPISSYLWEAISESPTAILCAGVNNGVSTIIALTLTTQGNTPVLGGGSTISTLPPGEQVLDLQAYLGSFLAIGTTKGVRVGTFDTYTGALTYGPLSVTTTAPVYSLAGRDRFIYATYTNQQPDGKTGLVTLDLSIQVDTAGRVAWAPGLKPPPSAPTGLGTVYAAAVLPGSLRVMFLTAEGIHVEGNGPGSNGQAWLRTSRIRNATDELKLFKYGRVHGSLSTSTISVTATTPFGGTANLGTFGFVTNADPGQFKLPVGLNQWMQLTFNLNGSSCVFNSYQVTTFPAPQRQHIISMTLFCMRKETDIHDREARDPDIPWVRYLNLRALESAGTEVDFVEFGNISGIRSERVIVDQLSFRTFERPKPLEDFAGYIDIKLRSTET
jgi:hypothetical protein